MRKPHSPGSVCMMFFGCLLGGLLIHGDAISQAEETRYIIPFQEGATVERQGTIITTTGGTLLQQISLLNAMVV